MTIHPSYGFEEAFLYAGSDCIISGLQRLAKACRNHGGPVFGLEIEITPFARLYGAQEVSVFFQHMTSARAIVCEDVETIVSCYAPQSHLDFAILKQNQAIVHRIADAVA